MSTTVIKELLGKRVVGITGMDRHGDFIWFSLDDGSTVKMFHIQCCCEEVWIEDVCGDPEDLIGVIVEATETVEDGTTDDMTWTFYRLSTAKGTVTLRWCGTSNGFYSESVDIEVVPPFRRFP